MSGGWADGNVRREFGFGRLLRGPVTVVANRRLYFLVAGDMRSTRGPASPVTSGNGCCNVRNVTHIFKYDMPATGHVGGDNVVSGTVARVKQGVVISTSLTLSLTGRSNNVRVGRRWCKQWLRGEFNGERL